MEYQNQIKEAVFYKRPNRFLAEVKLDGKRELVHVKNTWRKAAMQTGKQNIPLWLSTKGICW